MGPCAVVFQVNAPFQMLPLERLQSWWLHTIMPTLIHTVNGDDQHIEFKRLNGIESIPDYFQTTLMR